MNTYASTQGLVRPGAKKSFRIQSRSRNLVTQVRSQETIIRGYQSVRKKRPTIPRHDCCAPPAAVIAPMKTHSAVDCALLQGGVSPIQPTGRMRITHVHIYTVLGQSCAGGTVKSVPAFNHCPVTFLEPGQTSVVNASIQIRVSQVTVASLSW